MALGGWYTPVDYILCLLLGLLWVALQAIAVLANWGTISMGLGARAEK